jgi:hypothetical protein
MPNKPPLWSVMIPTYRGERHLAETLGSVLAQDAGADAMQIEVVDDGSPTAVEALVRRLASERVSVFRNEVNRGHVVAFNTCIARARGELVHLLHDDDAVRPGFYDRMASAFAAHPQIGAAFCRYIAVDEDGLWVKLAAAEQPHAGILERWHETIATGQRLQPPCIVVRKRVYEQLGGFDARIESYGEDWEMWTRIASAYPVWYEPEPLALYRVGRGGSLTSAAVRSGDNVRQLLQVIEINHARLPAAGAAAITARARRLTATTAVERGVRLARAGDARGALAQLRASLRADRSPSTLAHLAHGAARAAWALGPHAVRSRSAVGS